MNNEVTHAFSPKFIATIAVIEALLLAAGGVAASRAVWLMVLPLVAALGFWAWLVHSQQTRKFRDMPLSRVAEARPGWVEIQGRCRAPGGIILQSKLRNMPCIWYRYRIEYRAARHEPWQIVEQGVSQAPVMLNDGSGECMIDAAGATVIAHNQTTWQEGAYRYTEGWIPDGSTIYCLGELEQRGDPVRGAEMEAQVARLLEESSNDRTDVTLPGGTDDRRLEISQWERTRDLVRRNRASGRQPQRPPGEFSLVKPSQARHMFLLTDESPSMLVRRGARWSLAHLLVGAVATCSAAMVAWPT